MAVSTFTTTVNTLIARIVTLEPLAIAQVTSGTVAKKMWYWNSPTAPFWGNRPAGLIETQARRRWQLTIITRLWLGTMDASTVGTTTMQDNAWQYIPETLNYFTDCRRSLAPTGYAPINYIAPEGITITCPTGEDFGLFNPAVNYDAVYIEFVFTVPFIFEGL